MLTPEQITFRDRAVALAKDIAPEFGLDWRLMAATAILESGWGASELARQANNFFGVKAGNRTPDDQIHLLRTRRGPVRFRRFKSDEEAFRAYGRLVGGSRIYARAREAAREAALEHLVREIAPRYCPGDPDYALKIMQIVEMIDSLSDAA
ncbi:MAG TPA: glucosaminidase domain-containing protein [Sumerlaeia bacterium]|nr:glucosaminidase domain-containing protein [Sumerlaeia bacterium]